jgi:phosphomannomutase
MDDITKAIERAATGPVATLGGMEVVAVTDYREGAADRPRWLPATPLVEFSLEGGSRVLARPSGTEPKLKVYADITRPVFHVGEVPSARRAALAVAADASSDLIAHMGMR